MPIKNSSLPKAKVQRTVKQRKKHAPKSQAAAAIRRNRLVKALFDGECLKDIAISTGLSPKTAGSQATNILKHPEAQKTFAMILEEQGLSDQILAQKIRTLLDAKQTVFFQKDGEVRDQREVEALETQRKNAELVAKLKGHLREQSQVDVDIGIMALVVAAVKAEAEDEAG